MPQQLCTETHIRRHAHTQIHRHWSPRASTHAHTHTHTHTHKATTAKRLSNGIRPNNVDILGIASLCSQQRPMRFYVQRRWKRLKKKRKKKESKQQPQRQEQSVCLLRMWVGVGWRLGDGVSAENSTMGSLFTSTQLFPCKCSIFFEKVTSNVCTLFCIAYQKKKNPKKVFRTFRVFRSTVNSELVS